MKHVATNIRLPASTLQALKIRAAKERTSLAQLVRDAIESTYGLTSGSSAVDPKADPFYRVVGKWSSGRTNGAVEHDREIYGS